MTFGACALLLGEHALLFGDASFPQRCEHSAQQRHGENAGSRDLDLVTAHELPGAIAELIAARQDRQTVEIATDIFGEQIDGAIALVGLLPQCPQRDRIEIAIQRDLRARRRRIGLADFADRIVRRVERRPVRAAASEQQIKHDSKRVHRSPW